MQTFCVLLWGKFFFFKVVFVTKIGNFLCCDWTWDGYYDITQF